jgi:hypothetical protein
MNFVRSSLNIVGARSQERFGGEEIYRNKQVPGMLLETAVWQLCELLASSRRLEPEYVGK